MKAAGHPVLACRPSLFVVLGLLFVALLGLASCATPVQPVEVPENSPVSLSAQVVPDTDPDSLDLIILATVRNDSPVPIKLMNNGFSGILITGGEARSVIVAYATQPMMLLMQPGGRYVQKITLYPNFRRVELGISSGRHRMRLCYREPGKPSRLTVERQPNVVKDGVVSSLESNEFTVVIK